MIQPVYGFWAYALFAADSGTTIAIVLALITLLGTVSANLVAWHKIRTDARISTQDMAQEHKRSDVEIAQNVMSQTVVVLNDRLKNIREENDVRMSAMTDLHTREIQFLKLEHTRDIARLERKIDRITNEHTACKDENRRLRVELSECKGE